MLAQADFSLSRIVVVQSLEPHEVPTGKLLAEWLCNLTTAHAPEITVDLHNVESELEFSTLLIELTKKALAEGDWPVLHIECHGSEIDGLEFANGSTLSWKALGTQLTELNVATEFNLLTALSACYGGHLSSQFSPVMSSPVWGVIAPTKTIDPAEAMQGFRVFYSCFLQTCDVGAAASALYKVPISEGLWFSQLAELWYEALVVDYISTHCTHEAVRHWARAIVYKMRQQGRSATIGSVRRQLVLKTRSELSGKYFDRFFCIERVPSNGRRFANARKRIQQRINDLRTSGKYAL